MASRYAGRKLSPQLMTVCTSSKTRRETFLDERKESIRGLSRDSMFVMMILTSPDITRRRKWFLSLSPVRTSWQIPFFVSELL